MNMKINGSLSPLALMLGLAFSPSLLAQPDRGAGGLDREALRERMEVMAVGFLTEELALDAETAQVFWPMFNAHKDALGEARKLRQDAQRDLSDFDGEDQNEFLGILGRFEDAEVQLARLSAEFLREVSAEFGPEFAVRCAQAQKKFEQQMRSRMQQRMTDRNSPAPGHRRRPLGRQRR